MRKKLKVRSERLRNLTPAVLAAILGGHNAEPVCSAGPYKDSCWPDIPPR